MNQGTTLIEEWKEIRESLRYFGTKRFAQLTVFIAASGFMLNAYVGESELEDRWVLPLVGIALGVLFFLMERSSVRYWNSFAKRGEDIERILGDLRLMTHHRPAEALWSATNATYAVYLGTALLWLLPFLQPSPDTASLVAKALADAPCYAGNEESVWQLKSLTRDKSSSTYILLLQADGSQDMMTIELDSATGEVNEIQRPETLEQPAGGPAQ